MGDAGRTPWPRAGDDSGDGKAPPLREEEERGRAAGIVGANPSPSESGEGAGSGKATAALVLGIVGIAGALCCLVMGPVGLVCSVLAWVFGHQAVRAAQAGHAPAEGMSTARVGLILGIVGTVLNGLVLVGFLLYLFMVIFVSASGAASAA